MGFNSRNGVRTLGIGDILEVRLDAGNRWSDEGMTVEVKSITINHNARKERKECQWELTLEMELERLKLVIF